MATVIEKYSKTVSQTLDNLGYSQDIIEHRIRHYDDVDIIRNKSQYIFSNCLLTQMTAGSKAEGLTATHESDKDIMCITSNVICVNDPSSFMDQPDLTIFQTEIQEANPGYTRLKLIKLGIITNLRDSLFQENDGVRYISSILIAESFRKYMDSYDIFMLQEGPAYYIATKPNDIFYNNQDFVLAFNCMCPDLLNAYLNRPRKHGWPTLQVLEEISKADAHVVPVGNKESQESYKELRICFTKAETTLVRSLNDTQTKLYILLKMICKSMIKKTFPAITSYVLKNIVLWMAETNPQELFIEELLLERLNQSLYFLKIRVESGFIPNYMIPNRNLLAGKIIINSTQQKELVTLLTSLIKAGPYLVLQCPKLYRGLAMVNSQPNEAVTVAMKRNTIEKTHLLVYEKIIEIHHNGITDDQYIDKVASKPEFKQLKTILFDLVIPNWRTLSQQGRDFVTLYKHKLRKLLS